MPYTGARRALLCRVLHQVRSGICCRNMIIIFCRESSSHLEPDMSRTRSHLTRESLLPVRLNLYVDKFSFIDVRPLLKASGLQMTVIQHSPPLGQS
jgi:hypothetical protein